jgi:hypothetical protein
MPDVDSVQRSGSAHGSSAGPDARDDARQAHDERTAFSHLVVIGSLARRIW